MTDKETYFASNLRYLRLKNNLEQLELAEALGRKSSSTISEWESGKYSPKLSMLKTIASYFNVSLDHLTTTDLRLENNYINLTPKDDLVIISEQLSIENRDQLLHFGQQLLKKQEEKK